MNDEPKSYMIGYDLIGLIPKLYKYKLAIFFSILD